MKNHRHGDILRNKNCFKRVILKEENSMINLRKGINLKKRACKKEYTCVIAKSKLIKH